MACFHPTLAFQRRDCLTIAGKAILSFDPLKGLNPERYKPVTLGCGRCLGCRVQRSRTWAVRCVHESQMWLHNSFITLTFNNEHINDLHTLEKGDFQKFMKRLRKAHNGIQAQEKTTREIFPPGTEPLDNVHFPIRFFHCGEYGSKGGRPHHHACLFNFDFKDKYLWQIRDGVKLYRSPSLERLWTFGFSTIGEVTWESAAYVARYVLKKSTDANAYKRQLDDETEVEITPEYITMSRRPGIGKDWYERFKQDVYPKDYLTINGRKFKAPAYYDALYEAENFEDFQKIKEQRRAEADKVEMDLDPKRLAVRKACLKSRVDRLVRSL